MKFKPSDTRQKLAKVGNKSGTQTTSWKFKDMDTLQNAAKIPHEEFQGQAIIIINPFFSFGYIINDTYELGSYLDWCRVFYFE